MITVVFLLYQMGINPDDLNLIIEQAIQKAIETNRNTTNYNENMNKHKKC